jgi:Bacterial Ig-like domain (group 2)/Electron transfer DM13
MKKLLFVAMLASTFAACKKAGEDVPPPAVVTVPERLEITPTTSSILAGQTAQFTIKYYNNVGVLAATPAGVVWSSSSTTVATVNQTGLATALAVGQTNIKAMFNTISATAAITVVANSNVLSTITITPGTTQEVLLNGTVNLSAVGTNLAGGVIPGLTFNWASDAATSVQVNTAGLATGLTYGSANVTATANGIQSAPTMVQVIRQGNFAGQNSMGMAKLKIESGTLKLQTSSTFSVASAPDLRIYLTNTPTTITGALQIAPLSTAGQTSGARSWNIPAGVTITQYRYALVWCAQFGGVYGVADFGL